MTTHDVETRIGALLLRRLRAAPEEMRAMATAEIVDWSPPGFVADTGQAEAMHALLRACSDARLAFLGESCMSAASKKWVGSERLLALDRTIAAGGRALRMLRQRGIKATLATRERVDIAAKTMVLARAELGFRRRGFGATAAS
jgi:hypothetical protein